MMGSSPRSPAHETNALLIRPPYSIMSIAAPSTVKLFPSRPYWRQAHRLQCPNLTRGVWSCPDEFDQPTHPTIIKGEVELSVLGPEQTLSQTHIHD